MDRRDFLRFGAAGVSAAAVIDPTDVLAQSCTTTPATTTPNVHIRLAILDFTQMLVDGASVRMLGFRDMGPNAVCATNANDPSAVCGARVPGPILRVQEGWTVRMTIENTRPETHGFEITGVPAATTVIAGGSSVTFDFVAPPAGTYIYHDNFGGRGLYRIMGLAGVLISQPNYCGVAVPNPYGTRATPAIQAVFQALANPASMNDPVILARFRPGPWMTPGPWLPVTDFSQEYGRQEKIWAVTQVDPKFNDLITPSGITSSTLTSNVCDNFVPRYFLMDGRSGFDLSEGDDVVIKNYIGEPTLIRSVNLGMAHHSLHIHGNHIFELSEAALVSDVGPITNGYSYTRPSNSGAVVLRTNVLERDVWSMWPMQRKDVLLPLEVPPDIPEGQFAAMVARGKSVEAGEEYDSQYEPFPLRYVMHCHCEMSQTAGGGNYPQGLVTHWEIRGGRRPTTLASL